MVTGFSVRSNYGEIEVYYFSGGQSWYNGIKWEDSYIITIVKDVCQFSQINSQIKVKSTVASHNGNMINLTI